MDQDNFGRRVLKYCASIVGERPNDASGHRITWIPGSEFPILGFEDILDKLLNSPPTLSDGLDPCPEEECVMIGVCILGDTPVAGDGENILRMRKLI